MHTSKLFPQITAMYMECSSDQSSDLHEIAAGDLYSQKKARKGPSFSVSAH